MKQMKRAFAMLLCVAMVLSLCMTFAGAADAVYGPYATLDDIPENVNVFRSIRTGKYSYVESGDYYQFHEEGFPYVRIKPSAFTTQPTNAYLKADNLELSKHCKDIPTKVKDRDKNRPAQKENWSIERVAYVKTMTVADIPFIPDGTVKPIWFNVYTTSMYRLELRADAYNTDTLYTEAELTSGVTFEYLPKSNSLHRAILQKDPVRPSISVTVSDNTQGLLVRGSKIIQGFGKKSEISAEEMTNIGSNALSCVVGIASATATTPKALAIAQSVEACTPLVISASAYAFDRGYHTNLGEGVYDEYREIVASPIELQNSGDVVTTMFKLSDRYDKQNTNFILAFSFTSVPQHLIFQLMMAK